MVWVGFFPRCTWMQNAYRAETMCVEQFPLTLNSISFITVLLMAFKFAYKKPTFHIKHKSRTESKSNISFFFKFRHHFVKKLKELEMSKRYEKDWQFPVSSMNLHQFTPQRKQFKIQPSNQTGHLKQWGFDFSTYVYGKCLNCRPNS